jgi:hypothetical protein
LPILLTRENVAFSVISTSFVKMLHESRLLIKIEKVLELFRNFGFLDSHRAISAISKIKFAVILVFLITAIHNTISVEIRKNYPNESAFFIHVINHSFNSISAILPVISSFLYREKVAILLSKIKHIDEIFCKFRYVQANHKRLMKNLQIRNICFFVIFCGITLVIVIDILMTRPTILALMIYYYIPFTICGVSYLRLCFYIHLVAFYARTLDDTLEKSKSIIDDKEWTIYRLNVLSRIYRQLWETTQLINEIFSGYISVCFGNSLSGIIYRGYLFCDEMVSRGTLNIRLFLGIFQLMFLLSYVILVSEYCIKIVSDFVFDM